MSTFKIGSALRDVAAKINTMSIDKFPVLINRIIQKLHIKVIPPDKLQVFSTL